MKPIQVKSCKDQYNLEVNREVFSFQKNTQTSHVLNILYPHIEKSKNRLEKLQPQLHTQYQYSMQQIAVIQKQLEDQSFDEMEDQKIALEEALHLAIEWNYFLQDIYKEFDIELST